MESIFDAGLLNSFSGLFQIAVGGDDDLQQKVENALKKGAIAIPYSDEHGEHKPLNVGTDGLPVGQKVLKRKRNELYKSAYQTLDEASRRMTATEADARTRSGPAAALSVLAETMESAEEKILPIVAEAEDARRTTETLSPEVYWATD